MTHAAGQMLPAGSSPPAFSREKMQRFRESFAEHGYLIFRDVVSKSALSALRTGILDEFESVKTSGRLFSGGGTRSGHLNCFPGLGARAIYDELAQEGILDVVKSIFPNVLRLPNVGCNLNLPGSRAQHYHTDRPFTNEFAIVNVAMADTDLANGAIDLVRGTHRKFYKFWRFVLERADRASTRIEMKQGDVLVRTSNLWHRGMPNLTAGPRPMLAFTWEDGGSVLDDPFLAEDGKIAFRPNWFRTNWRGRLRERTFVAAPITYSAYRFVRSLVGDKGYDS